MDRDKIMSSDMDMGPAEVYTDGYGTPWKFVQRIIIPCRNLFKGYDTARNFLTGVRPIS
jgi:hypothetical protein